MVIWCEHPVWSSAFQRMMPGELPHEHISRERRKARQFQTLVKGSMAVEWSDAHLLGGSTAGSSSWKAMQAERMLARKKVSGTTVAVEMPREHPSLSLPSHTQVANVIAKCLPLQSVEHFRKAFDSCCPPQTEVDYIPSPKARSCETETRTTEEEGPTAICSCSGGGCTGTTDACPSGAITCLSITATWRR